MRKLKRTRKAKKTQKKRRTIRKQKGGNLGARNIPSSAVITNPMNLDMYRGDDAASP
jgi:hypothetical protein